VVAAAWSLTALRSRMKAFSLAGGVELARRRCITERMTGERSYAAKHGAPRRSWRCMDMAEGRSWARFGVLWCINGFGEPVCFRQREQR
jgi:hypothetical protein